MEGDNSGFDGVDGDRDSLLRLPLCYAMAASDYNLAATGRVAKEFPLVITSTLSDSSLFDHDRHYLSLSLSFSIQANFTSTKMRSTVPQ